MVQTRYSRVVPNSHSFGTLDNIMVMTTMESELVNLRDVEFLLTGFKNTLDRGLELEKIKEVNGMQGPCFIVIEDIIDYLESEDWTPRDFVFRVENTLKNGFDLKSKFIMEKIEVYNRVDGELDYQELRWVVRRDANGTPDESKPPSEWISYMRQHINQANTGVYNLDDEEAMAQIRKVVALGLRALMIHGCPERIIPEELLNQQ